MIKTLNSSDQQLLEGILTANSEQIKKIYDSVLPSVISYVKENSGVEEDAKDIFQEALMVLYQKLEQGDFTLTCTLKSFLRIMCRNLWLNRLRSLKRMDHRTIEELGMITLEDNLIDNLVESEKERIFLKHFNLLGEDCQFILKQFFGKVPLKIIAEELNTSENYIKKRKFLCKEKLIRSIKADLLYNELKNQNQNQN